MGVLDAATRATIQNNQSGVAAILSQTAPIGGSYVPTLLEQPINQYIDDISKGVDSSTFPIDLPLDGPHFILKAGTYARQNFTTIGTVNYQKDIKLPVPNNVMDHHMVAYSQEELGAVVGAALGGLNSAAQSFKKTGQIDAGQIGASTADAVAGGALGAGRDALNNALPGKSGSALEALAGLAVNDYLTILFKGPTYKKYSFEWKLAPRNKRESDLVRDLIVYLNNAMAPSFWFGTSIFGYPDIFLCAFSDKIRDYMYEFKPAVLDDFQVNYYGSGTPSFYHTGAPESVTIRMSFLELEFWLKGQFGKRYDSSITNNQGTTSQTTPSIGTR